LDAAQKKEPIRGSFDESVYAEVARAVLRIIPTLGERPTARDLADSLRTYRTAPGREAYFQDGERREGGGAVFARARMGEPAFDLLLPTVSFSSKPPASDH
jgi:hypothetical protein